MGIQALLNALLSDPTLLSMKNVLLRLSLMAVMMTLKAHAQQELPVGTLSDNVEFALFQPTGLTNARLSDFEGSIVVVYYYTPW